MSYVLQYAYSQYKLYKQCQFFKDKESKLANDKLEDIIPYLFSCKKKRQIEILTIRNIV